MTLTVAIRHDFPDFQLDVDFQVPPGLTVLFGPSGSGKTSIVNALAGLLRPTQGRIVLDERVLLDTAQNICLPAHQRGLGYVFQEGRLFPHMSVRQNLLYGQRARPAPGDQDGLEAVVAMLGIGDLLKRRPGALSGGEKQRVAIGRALLSQPSLILADEPLAALDQARKDEILPYFERLRDQARVPILYVSHSLNEVARLATSIICVEQGRITHAGPAAEVLADPQTALTMPGAGALLQARVTAHHEDGLSELDTGAGALFLPRIQAAPGSAVRVRIQAQDVMLSKGRPEGLSAINVLHGHIRDITLDQGPHAMLSIQVGEQVLLARITRRSLSTLQLERGNPCYAIMKSVTLHPGATGT